MHLYRVVVLRALFKTVSYAESNAMRAMSTKVSLAASCIRSLQRVIYRLLLRHRTALLPGKFEGSVIAYRSAGGGNLTLVAGLLARRLRSTDLLPQALSRAP